MYSSMKIVAYATLIPSITNSFSPVSHVTTNTHTTTPTKLNLSNHNDSNNNDNNNNNNTNNDRRSFMTQSFTSILAFTTTTFATATTNHKPAYAIDEPGFNVDDFLKTGQVAMPMGVSGQAGKSKPETGIVFRDGSELSRDTKSGDVLTEILLGEKEDPIAVVTSFSSPWPLAKGAVYDIECRDANNGDSVFLSLSDKVNGKSISELPNSFFLDKLFAKTGRFSFYGPPTDIKVKKSYMDETNKNMRIVELGFSILSQSTGAEIPRNAIIAATIPDGTDEAVMLVGSSTSTRWKKGTEAAVRKTVGTFSAVPAPKTGMKVRAKVVDSYL